jgi:hypothetical protein
MDHPAYGQDFAACDFFLWGCLKENLACQWFDADEELLSSVRAVLAVIPGESLVAVFAEWVRRLETCCDIGGECIE